MKHAALQFVRGKTVAPLQFQGMQHQLLGRPHLTVASLFIRIAVKQITGELDRIAHLTTQQLADRHSQFLAHDVQAGKLKRRMHLGAVVIQARGRIADRKAHRLQAKNIWPFR